MKYSQNQEVSTYKPSQKNTKTITKNAEIKCYKIYVLYHFISAFFVFVTGYSTSFRGVALFVNFVLKNVFYQVYISKSSHRIGVNKLNFRFSSSTNTFSVFMNFGFTSMIYFISPCFVASSSSEAILEILSANTN